MVGFKPKNPAEKRSKAKPVIKVIKIKPWKHKTVKTHTNYNCTWSKENFQQKKIQKPCSEKKKIKKKEERNEWTLPST